MSATPPGWYDDGHGARRWWDGIEWTEHVQPAAPFTAPAAPVQAPSPTAYTLAGDQHPAAATPYSAPGSAFTGTTAPGGALAYPAAPPAPPKSRLWILWTVLGVLALGAVITAIIVIPMVLAGLTGLTRSEGGSGTESGTNPGGSAPSEADEAAAVATVRLYDDAWQQVDCDKYFASTTETFRTDLELPDCATFEGNAQGFADSTEDYQVTITEVMQEDDVITVSTSETYSNLVDEDGVPLDSPEAVEDLWEYYLVQAGDGWLIEGAE